MRDGLRTPFKVRAMTTRVKLSDRLQQGARRIKRDGFTLWFACKHPATPWYAKALGAFVVAYALSPIDLIPDFIPCWVIWTTCCCCRG